MISPRQPASRQASTCRAVPSRSRAPSSLNSVIRAGNTPRQSTCIVPLLRLCRSDTVPQARAARGEVACGSTRIEAWQVVLPLHEGGYSWADGKSVKVFDSTVVAVHDRPGCHRLGRGLPARARLPAGLRQRRAHRHRRAGAGADRPRPQGARRPEPAHGPGAQGTPLRQVGDRHGVLGHPGQGCRPARLHPAGRPLRRRLRPLPCHLAGHARAHGGARRRISCRGLPQVPAQGRRRAAGRHRPHPRGRAKGSSPATC